MSDSVAPARPEMQFDRCLARINGRAGIPQPGELYQHFKGQVYEIVTVAIEVEATQIGLNDERLISVIYKRADLKKGDPGYYEASRSLANFTEHVDKPKFGYRGPRFSLLAGHGESRQ